MAGEKNYHLLAQRERIELVKMTYLETVSNPYEAILILIGLWKADNSYHDLNRMLIRVCA